VLAVDVEQLTRLAGAGPEVAVVEHEGGDALLRGALGIGVEAHLARAGEAVSHDNQRQWTVGVGELEPGGTAQTAGPKLDVATRERHALAPLRAKHEQDVTLD
jgi:hypothetical protein